MFAKNRGFAEWKTINDMEIIQKEKQGWGWAVKSKLKTGNWKFRDV